MAREVRRGRESHWDPIPECRVEEGRIELGVADLRRRGGHHRRTERLSVVRRPRDEEVGCCLVRRPDVAPRDVHRTVRAYRGDRERVPVLVDTWAADRLGLRESEAAVT